MLNTDTYIACPRCEWEPDGRAYWICTCGTTWDTFSTGGQCPSCHRQWETTQCIDHAGGCGQFSPHKSWYHSLDDWLKRQMDEVWKMAPSLRDVKIFLLGKDDRNQMY